MEVLFLRLHYASAGRGILWRSPLRSKASQPFHRWLGLNLCDDFLSERTKYHLLGREIADGYSFVKG